MNAIIEVDYEDPQLPAVLMASQYPGANLSSVQMVIEYCKAGNLDPLQKPVQIVPMWDPGARAYRDVIMPGISLYRIQAARSGEYGGIDEPDYGPDVTTTVGSREITYPEWCKITVYRFVKGQKVAFVAKEYWIENYAIKGGKEQDQSPNRMWSKRTRGQLTKCAEAQALRKAFPELCSHYTAEEMEGKEILTGEIDITDQAQVVVAELSPEQVDEIKELLKQAALDEAYICEKAGVDSITKIHPDRLEGCKRHISAKIPGGRAAA